jgi:hypothetical protein
MFEKINVCSIIKDHLVTLKNYNDSELNETSNPSIEDIFIFFISPLIIAAIIVYFHFVLTKDIISILVPSLSIFAALLFNLLLLIYDITRNKNNNDEESEITKLKQSFLKQIYSNISYSILVAVIAVAFSVITYFYLTCIGKENTPSSYIILPMSFGVYFLGIQFILTLLMILKRIHVLLAKEFEDNNSSNNYND